jgi:hypothetical protein
MRNLLLAALLLATACGGRTGSAPTAPVASSAEAVTAFMRAAADSNLTRMAQLWGTERGPVSEVPLDNYEKRVAVMQAYLRGDSARIVSDIASPEDANRRRLTVALYRGTCVKQIPFTTVRIKSGGWIVESVDLSAAGNPARPCEPGSE